jgi:hypothetical protein
MSGTCQRHLPPPLATGGDPGSDNQVLAMVTKRGRTAKSSQEFCLDLFAGIPADLAMLFECQWAAKAQQFAGGNLSVFSQDIIDGYWYEIRHCRGVQVGLKQGIFEGFGATPRRTKRGPKIGHSVGRYLC